MLVHTYGTDCFHIPSRIFQLVPCALRFGKTTWFNLKWKRVRTLRTVPKSLCPTQDVERVREEIESVSPCQQLTVPPFFAPPSSSNIRNDCIEAFTHPHLERRWRRGKILEKQPTKVNKECCQYYHLRASRRFLSLFHLFTSFRARCKRFPFHFTLSTLQLFSFSFFFKFFPALL